MLLPTKGMTSKEPGPEGPDRGGDRRCKKKGFLSPTSEKKKTRELQENDKRKRERGTMNSRGRDAHLYLKGKGPGPDTWVERKKGRA